MKDYTSPSIAVAGSVRQLTAKGGGIDQVDVPLGTPSFGDLDNVIGFTGS